MVDRIPTYIEGFDEHLEGGIPEGTILLLAGSTGSMKSSVAYSILHHNAAAGKKGLYISLEQNEKSILRQMAKMGMDTNKVVQNLMIFDFGSMMIDEKSAGDNWVASVIKTIQHVKDGEGLDLLVLDSLNAYVLLGGSQFDRKTLFKFFEYGWTSTAHAKSRDSSAGSGFDASSLRWLRPLRHQMGHFPGDHLEHFVQAPEEGSFLPASGVPEYCQCEPVLPDSR